MQPFGPVEFNILTGVENIETSYPEGHPKPKQNRRHFCGRRYREPPGQRGQAENRSQEEVAERGESLGVAVESGPDQGHRRESQAHGIEQPAGPHKNQGAGRDEDTRFKKADLPGNQRACLRPRIF
jgi:hypothetical protein